MKKRLLFLAMMSFGLASPSFAQSVCAANAANVSYTCSLVTPRCYNMINTVQPSPPQIPFTPGTFYVRHDVPCCGISVPEWIYSGACENSELRSPEVQQRLAELYTTTDILIVNCEHHYMAIERQLQAPVDTSVSFEAEDRILR